MRHCDGEKAMPTIQDRLGGMRVRVPSLQGQSRILATEGWIRRMRSLRSWRWAT